MLLEKSPAGNKPVGLFSFILANRSRDRAYLAFLIKGPDDQSLSPGCHKQCNYLLTLII